MALSIREQIMQALTARAQGYIASASRNPIAIDETGLPGITVIDTDETAEPPQYKRQAMTLEVAVVLVDSFDASTETVSVLTNAHLAELIRIFTGSDTTLGGLCDRLVYASSSIQYPSNTQNTYAVTLTLTISYGYALGDPYTPTRT